MISRIRIAHLSDSHLLDDSAEARSLGDRVRLGYLSMLRPRLVKRRIERLRSALESARELGFDHLVMTGDLTEEGRASQFELLSEVLLGSGIPSERITIVPGNHDVYDAADGWEGALRGPLAPFSAASTRPVAIGDTTIIPVNTAIHQHWLYSHGAASALERLELDLERAVGISRRVVLVQHHPPIPYTLAPVQWADGLRNFASLQGLMQRWGVTAILHGHVHRARDLRTPWLSADRPHNVYSAPAVVSSAGELVRYYDTCDDGLRSVRADG